MTRIRIRITQACMLAFTLAACGVEEKTLPVSTEQSYAIAPAPTPTTTVQPTVQLTPLTCVSEASQRAGEAFASIDHVSLTFDGATATMSFERGPQFRSHNGTLSASSTGNGETRSAKVSVGNAVQLVDDTYGGTSITLTRRAPFWFGSMSGGHSGALTCWNEFEVFGSTWGGSGGALTAHFNWETGRCEGPDHAPALNAVPIEVVREKSNGECDDLSGAALNGSDFANPDLLGWNLIGAKLDGARLFFANLSSASLFGAQMSKLEFGYATVSGSIDAHTQLPADPAACQTQDSPWAGTTVHCVQ